MTITQLLKITVETSAYTLNDHQFLLKRQWENYVIIELQLPTKIIGKWTPTYCWQDIFICMYIYISLWTISKLRLIIPLGFHGGWVCFQNKREKGKKNRVRGEKNILHTQQHGFDPITCWPLLLCIMLDW